MGIIEEKYRADITLKDGTSELPEVAECLITQQNGTNLRMIHRFVATKKFLDSNVPDDGRTFNPESAAKAVVKSIGLFSLLNGVSKSIEEKKGVCARCSSNQPTLYTACMSLVKLKVPLT